MKNSFIHPKTPEKGRLIRRMFSEIAPRYDLLNHLLSINIDKRWRKFTAVKIEKNLSAVDPICLDLCCGTGDLSYELAYLAQTIGLDFCRPMLEKARTKPVTRPYTIWFIEGDALHAPFPDMTFDAVTVAFGLRNLENISGGLEEIYRLLKPCGMAGILEFSSPVSPIFGSLFKFYFRHLLPRIGAIMSGSSYAYRYLFDSVSQFPDQKQLSALMQEIGFCSVEYYNLSGGIAALYTGVRQRG